MRTCDEGRQQQQHQQQQPDPGGAQTGKGCGTKTHPAACSAVMFTSASPYIFEAAHVANKHERRIVVDLAMPSRPWCGRADEVAANIDSRKEAVVDARPPGRFDGSAPEPRPGIPSGHIPGSVNVPFPTVLTKDGR